jgi:hypothetical protein
MSRRVAYTYLDLVLQENGPGLIPPPDDLTIIQTDPNDGLPEAEGYEAATLLIDYNVEPHVAFHKTHEQALAAALLWSNADQTRKHH